MGKVPIERTNGLHPRVSLKDLGRVGRAPLFFGPAPSPRKHFLNTFEHPGGGGVAQRGGSQQSFRGSIGVNEGLVKGDLVAWPEQTMGYTLFVLAAND